MTITRGINGDTVTIALTETELFDAYREAQHIYDMEDVTSKLEEMEADDMFSPEEVSEIASWSRGYQDDNDSIAESLWGCVDYAIRKYAEDNDITLPDC